MDEEDAIVINKDRLAAAQRSAENRLRTKGLKLVGGWSGTHTPNHYFAHCTLRDRRMVAKMILRDGSVILRVFEERIKPIVFPSPA